MSDITTKQIEIVLKGRDDGSLNLLGQAEKRVTSLAQALHQGGDIGELGGLKKFGKNLGEFMGTSQAGTISGNADQMRNQAAAEYAERLKDIVAVERQAEVVDKARVGAMRERAQAAENLKRQLAEINAAEKTQIQNAMSRGLLKGEYGPAEIKQEAAVSRAAAEKAYQDVLTRTVDVQYRAAKSDEERRKAFLAKAEAARQYGKQLEQINAAEANALKGTGGGLARGLAIAGGTLAAINIVSKVIVAIGDANEKLREGKIRATEWVGEVGMGIPVIKQVLTGLGSALQVITGIKKATKENNLETEKWDKIIEARNAKRASGRQLIDSVLAGTSSIGESERDRILRESGDLLTKIRDARKQGKDSIALDDGRSAGLDDAERRVIADREKRLGDIEAEERKKRAEKLREVDDQIEQGNQSVYRERIQQRIADLKEQGKAEEAAQLQINLDADARRAELLKKRQSLESQGGLTDEQRIGLNDSIDRQLAANEETRNARRAAAAREAQKNAAEKEKEARDKAEAELRDRRVKAIESQQAARTSEFDARGQTGFFNQSKSVTLETINQKTADNTAKTNDKLDKLIMTFEQFTRAGGQLIAL